LNLIGNAYKFTPEEGKITLSLRQTGQVCQGSAPYELRVSDNGIGMSKEFTEKVFDAFERERSSTVSGIQGTGLGMTITKSIVDLMGGEISVKSEKGKGTEFLLEFNFLVLEDDEFCKISEAEHAAESQAAQEKGVDFQGRRLLLVDDVEVNREIAAMILQEMGFEVETASNGKEALDKVSEAKAGYYDAVLMDIQMPEMDGYEATKRIRALADDEKAVVPIVAMTANAFEEDRKNAFAAGMNAHIAKPIDEAKLISVLEVVLC
jgi:CheY-like chemotaxis protein/anti-sigma regulatory factor (Ser/Thr protein kinase)